MSPGNKNANHSVPVSQTAKTAPIKRVAVRESGVTWYHEGLIKDH